MSLCPSADLSGPQRWSRGTCPAPPAPRRTWGSCTDTRWHQGALPARRLLGLGQRLQSPAEVPQNSRNHAGPSLARQHLACTGTARCQPCAPQGSTREVPCHRGSATASPEHEAGFGRPAPPQRLAFQSPAPLHPWNVSGGPCTPTRACSCPQHAHTDAHTCAHAPAHRGMHGHTVAHVHTRPRHTRLRAHVHTQARGHLFTHRLQAQIPHAGS